MNSRQDDPPAPAGEDSGAAAPVAVKTDRASVATPWQLFWWRFLRHRLAVASGLLIGLLYLVAVLADFVAPYSSSRREFRLSYLPPQAVHVEIDGLVPRLYVHGISRTMDPNTGRAVYAETEARFRVVFLTRGESYRVLGLFESNLRLFGVEDGGRLFLWGTDSAGRCVLSQTIHGARISLFIGLLAVVLSLALGATIGAVSGYYGGMIDHAVQRLIEVLRSIPGIALWMSLSAALPRDWTQLQMYFAIILILSLLGWTTLAREVRGRVLSLRNEDFVVAARLSGCSTFRLLRVHLIPSLTSHIIATLTLAIPAIILAETSLSFLGIGLSRPMVSWGVLLQQAQSVEALMAAPWLFLPGVVLIVTVLAFNFLGDGLRDAADPYAKSS